MPTHPFTPTHRQQLIAALLDAFASRDELDRLVWVAFEQNPQTIIAERVNLTRAVEEVVEEATSRDGGVRRLVAAATVERAGHIGLVELEQAWRNIEFALIPKPITGSAYEVEGINPYLGLRAFNYEDRAIYAGREQLARETVQRLTVPGAQQTILFITGASGSGKSSFAQAALIPLLENHYDAYQKRICHAIFRPSNKPLVMLADALQKLHSALTPETLVTGTPKDQINLLLIDQFEELFIQSEASQRAPFCAFLTNLPSFADCHTHILITLRVDYLDELFGIQPLWTIAKDGVELRTMSADDLRNAIQKPMQVNYSQKRFAPELLDRLVQDAAEDAALLPLLQVTLAELWKTGKLVLSNYQSLTNAIRQRADTVYDFSDYDKAAPQIGRSTERQTELMAILLDLINVSVGDDDRRDVRQRRTRQELEKGSTQRPRLIEELINARLLAAASETRNGADVEVIDIIHESLINNWNRLRDAIEEQRQQLQRRARFRQSLEEWLRKGCKSGALLTDLQIAEARLLIEGGDIEIQSEDAQKFYQRSKAKQRWSYGMRIAAIIVFFMAGVAGWQWHQAENAKVIAETARDESNRLKEEIHADQLAQKAIVLANDEDSPQASLLLAVEAMRVVTPPIPSTLTSINRLLSTIGGETIGRFQDTAEEVAVSNDGHWLAGGGKDHTIQVWSLTDLKRPPIQLDGHIGSISDLAFSPDNRWLASASMDHTIRLWSVGESITSSIVLTYHQDAVSVLAFSPNSNWLASGSRDNTIGLWSLTPDDGRESTRISAHYPYVEGIAFSPDNTVFASTGKDHTIRIWSITSTGITAKYTLTLEGNPEWINMIQFSPDGKWFASADSDGKIRLWETENLDADPLLLTGHSENATALAFSPDSHILATGSQDSIVRLWHLDEKNSQWNLASLRDTLDTIYQIRFSPNGRFLAVGRQNNSILVWDLAQTNKDSVELVGHEKAPREFEFTPDNRYLVSSSDDKTIRLWNIEQPTDNPVLLRGHHSRVNSIVLSPDEQWLASSSQDHTIKLWLLNERFQKPVDIPEQQGGANSQSFDSTGQWLASIGNDKTLRLWSLKTIPITATIISNQDSGQFAIFSPNGRWLANDSENSTLRVWSMTDGVAKIVISDEQHSGPINSIAFSPNSYWLATASDDTIIRLWAMDSTDTTRYTFSEHTGSVTTVVFSPDSQMFASSSKDDSIRIWSLNHLQDSPTVLRSGHTGDITALRFSPDGQWIASVSNDNNIRVWSMNDLLLPPIVFSGHQDRIVALAFSSDSQWLASSSIDTDKRVLLWSLKAPDRQPVQLFGYKDIITQLIFSSQHDWLIGSGSDSSVYIWTIDPEKLISLACTIAGREIDENKEWDTFFPGEQYRHTCPLADSNTLFDTVQKSN